MGCSMGTDRQTVRLERRRRFGVVSPPFLKRKEKGKGRKGKQDKGSVSRPLPSLCLHILSSRDRHARPRDSHGMSDGNQPFSARNRETEARCDV